MSPFPGVVDFYTLDSNLSAPDVAAILQNKIPGVTSLVAIGPQMLMYTISPSLKASDAKTVSATLKNALDKVPHQNVVTEVLDVPNGFQGACGMIATIGHQVQGVVSLAAISDTRIMAGLDSTDAAKAQAAKRELQHLIDELAVTTVAAAPPVQSVTMRLYYDRDAVSVAAAVSAAFSQLKVTSVSMNPANTYRDTIVIADPTGSADAQTLDQARRMVAQLDEPRPQMVVNAWSLQVSSDNPNGAELVVPNTRRLASGYNDALENAVGRGWRFINTVGSVPFDPLFLAYLCRSAQFVNASWDTDRNLPGPCQGIKLDPDTKLPYGLGYTSLVGTESPDLIQMLLLVMASKTPRITANATLDEMEGVYGAPAYCDTETTTKALPGMRPTSHCESPVSSCRDIDEGFYSQQQKSLGDLALRKEKDSDKLGATLQERLRTENALPFVAFGCIRQKLNELTQPGAVGKQYTSSMVGLFRASVADYLFQNKMKVEYPNDFQPFLYPASAATLDAVLTPLVEAFNQDLEVLQEHLQRQLTEGVPQDRHLHYSSNGLVSVKVVSGNQAQVQTQSLNYFPQNPVMTFEEFAKQIAAGQASTSAIPLLAGSLSSVAATTAAYLAAQPAQVTAKVGSGLSMTVTPFTLSSAKGAELNVNVTYNENGAATLSSDSTQSSTTDDLNSRVAAHQVNTLVRMDSLKFFEVSTMQSVIARERKPWKPFDPVFELPLFDLPGFGGHRRKPDVLYEQSVIFMEASIMPTAADLGEALIPTEDLVDSALCAPPDEGLGRTPEKKTVAHRAEQFCDKDQKKLPALNKIMDYHKAMVAFFASQFLNSEGAVVAMQDRSIPTMESNDPGLTPKAPPAKAP